jgi:hypothetical protein
MICSSRFYNSLLVIYQYKKWPHLKPLVLQDLLDSHEFPALDQLGLVDNAKTSISYGLCVRVADFLWPVWSRAWCRYYCRYLGAC